MSIRRASGSSLHRLRVLKAKDRLMNTESHYPQKVVLTQAGKMRSLIGIAVITQRLHLLAPRPTCNNTILHEPSKVISNRMSNRELH